MEKTPSRENLIRGDKKINYLFILQCNSPFRNIELLMSLIGKLIDMFSNK